MIKNEVHAYSDMMMGDLVGAVSRPIRISRLFHIVETRTSNTHSLSSMIRTSEVEKGKDIEGRENKEVRGYWLVDATLS
ncbi:hypothetical protein M0802_001250 [Mischocyttarus mexicanus]|nr:hypothetical protein M0802_001250 [Mischocyttarus mexicanus]